MDLVNHPIYLNTLEEFFAYNPEERNLEIYLKNPNNIETQTLIVKQVFKMIKKSNHLNRLVTLSPMTEMARNFHLKNGAEEIQVNEETQNFEYKIIK